MSLRSRRTILDERAPGTSRTDTPDTLSCASIHQADSRLQTTRQLNVLSTENRVERIYSLRMEQSSDDLDPDVSVIQPSSHCVHCELAKVALKKPMGHSLQRITPEPLPAA